MSAQKSVPPAAGLGTPAIPDPLGDPFVRRFVAIAVHVKRFAPHYAVAFVWLLVMAFVKSPHSAPLAGATTGALTQTAVRPATASVAATPDLSASADDTTFTDSLGLGTTDSTPFLQPVTPTDSPSSSGFIEPVVTPESSVTEPPAPRPLSIIKSGYASSSAGTPLEQAPPENGLPVALAGTQITKYSFIQLVGDLPTLHLKLAGAATDNPGADQSFAILRICHITSSGWEAKRAQTMAAAPTYDADCVNSSRLADGSFQFDMSGFPNVTSGDGWAIVPSTNTPAAFQVVLSPVTLAPAAG